MVARTGGRRRRGEGERWIATFCGGDECSGSHQLLKLLGQGNSEPPPSATLHFQIVHQLGEAVSGTNPDTTAPLLKQCWNKQRSVCFSRGAVVGYSHTTPHSSSSLLQIRTPQYLCWNRQTCCSTKSDPGKDERVPARSRSQGVLHDEAKRQRDIGAALYPRVNASRRAPSSEERESELRSRRCPIFQKTRNFTIHSSDVQIEDCPGPC